MAAEFTPSADASAPPPGWNGSEASNYCAAVLPEVPNGAASPPPANQFPADGGTPQASEHIQDLIAKKIEEIETIRQQEDEEEKKIGMCREGFLSFASLTHHENFFLLSARNKETYERTGTIP